MGVYKGVDYVEGCWNKYRRFKDKISHEAIKEYWQEGMESELGVQDKKSFGVRHYLNTLSAADEEYEAGEINDLSFG